VKSIVTLRIIGDNLDPDEISNLLGCAPTASETKGDVIVRKTGRQRIARTGMWRLHSSDHEPANLDAQIDEILDKSSGDVCVWQELRGKYKIDLFCGLFLGSGNERIAISSKLLAAPWPAWNSIIVGHLRAGLTRHHFPPAFAPRN